MGSKANRTRNKFIKKNLEGLSTYDLIKELIKRKSKDGTGLLNSKANEKVISKLKKDNNHPIGIILTLGYPKKIAPKTHKCSHCHKLKGHKHFGYYLSRVDSEGYLMRSNALCDECSKKSNNKRSKILTGAAKDGLIPERPKKGDTCTNCSRPWYGKWHRDHDDINGTFTGWICGNCNMKKSDQREASKPK